jgi:hypothetical protein
MKYLALGLLIVSSAVWTIAPSTTNAQTAQPTIAKGDPDFSIVLNSRHTSPLDGSHVPQIFPISAAAHGPHSASHMQIYVDGTKYAEYLNVSTLPAGTKVVLSQPGVHRIAVQSHDQTTGNWVKSVIYVTSP